MKKKNLSRGVLLVNLGTPKSPTTKSIRQYLKEFLSDKRIIDIFWLFRLLLLYCIILPIRSKKSAKLYKNIWMSDGSPLLHWGNKLKTRLQTELGSQYTVALAMRYGEPSIQNGIKELQKNNVETITVIPLFPQYAASTTASVIEEVSNQLNTNWHITPYSFIKSFFDHPDFIAAQKEKLELVLKQTSPEMILFSYHGLPVRHLEKSKQNHFQSTCLENQNCCDQYTDKNAFCYRAQCFETTRLIAEACSLPKKSYITTFQSRFGRDKWTTPDTQEILKKLRDDGIKKLVVVCPGFVADCLETLEEIGIRLKKDWIALGGSELVLIESLNDNEKWICCLKDIIEKNHFF